MSDFLGVDFLADESGDILFDVDDIPPCSGASLVAQDIMLALDQSDIMNHLNSDKVDEKDIKEIIENVCLDEPRLDPDSLKINVSSYLLNNETHFSANISFSVVGEDNNSNLVYDTKRFLGVL